MQARFMKNDDQIALVRIESFVFHGNDLSATVIGHIAGHDIDGNPTWKRETLRRTKDQLEEVLTPGDWQALRRIAKRICLDDPAERRGATVVIDEDAEPTSR